MLYFSTAYKLAQAVGKVAKLSKKALLAPLQSEFSPGFPQKVSKNLPSLYFPST
jgi:hypothetical protein